MVSVRSKSALFEEHEIPTEGSGTLHARMMLPKPPVAPKRLVLIPPLVGGSASQGLVIFRNLTRRGFILLSFAYRGHPRSTGRFQLDHTIVDTRHALRWSENYARRRGLPLHAFAMCYGVVPLAAQFQRGAGRCPLWSLSTISGLFRLDQIIRFEDFAPVFSNHAGMELDSALQSPGITDDYDWRGDGFRGGLREYLTGLFPGLRVGWDYFEELQYDRVDVRSTILQLLRARYLDSIAIPAKLPCKVVYGRNDKILLLQSPEGRGAYRTHALSLMPHAAFREWEVDHFGQGPEREALIEDLGDFAEQSEARAVDLSDNTPGIREIRQ
jgi:hypothetical protein